MIQAGMIVRRNRRKADYFYAVTEMVTIGTHKLAKLQRLRKDGIGLGFAKLASTRDGLGEELILYTVVTDVPVALKGWTK